MGTNRISKFLRKYVRASDFPRNNILIVSRELSEMIDEWDHLGGQTNSAYSRAQIEMQL